MLRKWLGKARFHIHVDQVLYALDVGELCKYFREITLWYIELQERNSILSYSYSNDVIILNLTSI